MHINPDHFLRTAQGRVVTPERNEMAWEECYRVLERALANTEKNGRVFVLIGPQGAGKSTWARLHVAISPGEIVFDAILVRRAERERIIQSVKRHGGRAVAVVFSTPLDDCIARNASRPADERVPEQAIRNVHAAVEVPALDEGFDDILVVP